MTTEDKNRLIKLLTESHSATQATIKGANPELTIYEDTDWRIRDILGHIATWDREVTKSLRAFLNGTDYFIPGINEDETDFNEQAVVEQRDFSTHQIVAEWEQARKDLKAALSEIPTDRFPGDLRYPWGDERGSIARMVEYMIEHDEEHRDEIVKVLQAPQKE